VYLYPPVDEQNTTIIIQLFIIIFTIWFRNDPQLIDDIVKDIWKMLSLRYPNELQNLILENVVPEVS